MAISVALATPAVAQESLGQGFGQSLRNLSPDQRQQKRQQYFSTLPESEQQKLRERQRKFHALPGNQKLTLCQQFLSQNGYIPPACQSNLDD